METDLEYLTKMYNYVNVSVITSEPNCLAAPPRHRAANADNMI